MVNMIAQNLASVDSPTDVNRLHSKLIELMTTKERTAMAAIAVLYTG
jgi:hypothetical protein